MRPSATPTGATAPDPSATRRGVEALYSTGYRLLSEDRPADAASVFRAMALLAPTDERSWLALGASHEALGQPELALQMYGTGHALAAPSALCDVARARVLYRQRHDEEAERALDDATRAAEARRDPELVDLVARERRTP